MTSRQPMGVALTLAVPTGLAVFAAAWLYGGPSAGDDTFIYMRYVRNVLTGHGFVFNVGEASAGITSYIWAFLMAGIARVAGNTLLVYKAVSTLLFAVACALLAVACRRRALPAGAALGLAAVLALEPHTLRWAASGMENGLAVLALVAVALCFTAPRATPAAGVSAGLLPFVRPELGLYSSGAVFLAFLRRKRRAWLFAAVAAMTGLALAAAVYAAFGALLPQTATAKALFLRQQVSGYAVVQSMKILLSGALPGLVLLVAGLRSASPPVRAWGLLTLVSLGTTILYLGARNHLVSTRYGTVLSGPIVLAAVLVAADRWSRDLHPRGYAAALLLQAALSLALLVRTYPATRVAEHEEIGKVADFVAARVEPGARIALTEIGAFGFASDFYIIDLVGLTDPETLAWGRRHGAPRSIADLEQLLIHRRAQVYIDAFAGPTPIEGAQLRFEPLGEIPVRRRNLSSGRIVPDLWRVYRLRPAASP